MRIASFVRFAIAVGIAAAAVLVLFAVLLFTAPERLIKTLRRRSPEVLYSVERDDKVVALTIDDGPDAEDTPKILDVLKKYNAHATFFLITGHIPGNEEIVKRTLAEGHELGNHFTADEPGIALSDEAFERKLLMADAALREFTPEIKWARPGSGWYNDRMLATIRKHGYRAALGSVYPYDPQIGSSRFSAYYVLAKTRPGAIIILHDYDKRGARTARALEMILPALVKRGYRIVTLSELVEGGQ